MQNIKISIIELNARERAIALLDKGTFRELLDAFDRVESPHLEQQGIVPQSDDGVIVARGQIGGEPAVVISIEGSFQGGGIGEVSGAKIAGALELALRDNQESIRTVPVVIFDTGGVRLQEANYGLLAISEIQAAVVALRHYVPLVGVIPGKVGCFGGMSITAAMFSHLIMTQEGRFGLNGPEVIEQEAGLEEFDSNDRALVWGTIGGRQRYETGWVDELVEDEIEAVSQAVKKAFRTDQRQSKVQKVAAYRDLLRQVDPAQLMDPVSFRKWWREIKPLNSIELISSLTQIMPGSRGRTWFKALAEFEQSATDVPSVLCGDSVLGQERVRYISVVPNPNHRFPRARDGEVGIDEGWAIARYVREAIQEDNDGDRRVIVAIVDVPSQAYGYQEELLGIHYSCAAAVDAYASARLAGHPVIALIVGKAISGAFLTHGYQANRILAFNDDGVSVHAMSKKSAARITRRSLEELEEATKKVPGMAYDIRSYASLGALHEFIDVNNPDKPTDKDINTTKNKLVEAILDARLGPRDLSHRLKEGRPASIHVRAKLEVQW